MKKRFPGPPPEPPADDSPETSARIPARSITFPPSAWDREDAVISSARRTEPPVAPDQPLVGDEPHLHEADARRLLDARFAAAGVALQPDYAFREVDLMVHLDGYDPARRIGYAFVSHGDADVVTDFDGAAELAFQQLAADGRVFVLVVHDADVPTADALEHRIDAFFDQVRRLAP